MENEVNVSVEETTTKVNIPAEEEKPKVDPRVAQDNITPDFPRFREVYGKMKSLERKVEEYEEKEKSNEKLLTELKSHNERLARAIESQVELSYAGMDTTDYEIDDLIGHLSELKAKKVEALKTFDYEEVVELDEAIAETKDEINRVRYYRDVAMVDETDGEVDNIFLTFVDETPWFNGDDADPLMIQAAYEMDRVLLRDPKWQNRPLPERLAEVRRRVEARFDWKPKGRPTSGVEGVSRVSAGRVTSVTLSPEQVAVAKGLGISLTDYAKQIAIIEGGKR
ncbi:MAG: hypothetical protein DDT19_00866 [Syntrophomonadaceae bacterium]|nr:hypothetical protein [Bacillota bacterium]